jgi:hypothetical protein
MNQRWQQWELLRKQKLPNQRSVNLRKIIQRTVNKHLSESVSPMLLWDEQTKTLSLFYLPKNLLSFLWVQLAKAIEDKKEYGFCSASRCGKPIEIGEIRIDAKFCSEVCKAWAYRKRKKNKSSAPLQANQNQQQKQEGENIMAKPENWNELSPSEKADVVDHLLQRPERVEVLVNEFRSVGLEEMRNAEYPPISDIGDIEMLLEVCPHVFETIANTQSGE